MAPPAAPSNLVATAISSSRIDLTWDDNASDETKFEVERSANGVSGWVEIAEPAANAESYTDSPLPQNTQFYYRVRAANADGASAYTAVANATTLLPGRQPINPRMYLHNPAVVLAARVNWPVASYPLHHFDVDGVTTGSVADVKAGMTLLIGSSAGADNYGRQRVRLDGSGARLYVGRSSFGNHDGELMVVDDAYVTVLDDRRVWAKIPYIAPDGTIYKDSDLVVGTNTTTPPPVANTGPAMAGTIDPDDEVLVCFFNGQSSFATADGATISSYLWDIADGTLLTGASLTTDTTFASFPAGFRYVSLTVTDSNSKTHTAYCPVYARDPANDTSFEEFVIESHRITAQGQQMAVRILADAPRLAYPDGTLAMLWLSGEEGIANRQHMLICGWLDTEPAQMQAGRTGLLRDTTLNIVDVAGRLDRLPGLPQTLADDTTRDTDDLPAITWNYMTTPNLDKYLHYLLHWHSTALEVADFVWSDTGDEFEFVLLASDGESLWAQVDRRARAFLPDFALTCNRFGAIRIVPDPMLRDEADRTAVVLRSILEHEWSDIRYVWQRHPRAHWLRASAIVAGTSDPIETVFSIAPGDTPGQGVGEVMQGEQLAASQAALNAATGHRYARANNPLGLLSITLVQDDGAAGTNIPWHEIEPALMQWVQLTVSAETAAQRGLTFAAARFLPKEMNIRYNHGRTGITRTLELLLEQETVGTPGKTVLKPNVPPVGDQPPPPTEPPDFGLTDGQELVAGIGLDGYVYRTTDFQTPSGSGGPTWDRVDTGIADTIYSWVVDPFSPGYISGSGAINGWIVNDTAIYRVTDLFGTPGVSAVHTFAQATSGASFHWRTIQASFGAFFAENNPWLVCISYYGDTTGHEGTWATFSTDAGATWSSEVQVSEGFDSEDATRFNPIGVYTSPKTPGLAYTAAHVDSDGDGVLPRWGIWPDGGSLTVLEPRISAGIETAQAGTGEDETNLLIAPHPDTKRIDLQIDWVYTRSTPGAGGSTSTLTRTKPSNVSMTGGSNFSNSNPNSTASGSFTNTHEKISGTWPVDRDSIISSPPSAPDTPQPILFNLATNIVGASNSGAASIQVTITEIEMMDGTIYNPSTEAVGFVSTDYGATWAETALIDPGQAQAGSIHLPWPNNDDENLAYYGHFDVNINREFRLMQVLDGVATDISPSDGTRSYGANRYGFAIRAFDSNRQYLLLAGTGNDTSTDPDDDMHAVYVSDDFGATWAEVVAPEADSNAPTGRAAFEAAFAGDTEQVLYLWGKDSYIAYSDDFGANVDDRSGNLASSFTAGAFCGIAGGPT